MDIDLSTFILEVVNFLILVWIMNRILYRPVRRIIDQRREALEKIRAEADRAGREATELQQTYQGRLASWDAEKAELRRTLQEEIAAERQRLMAGLQEELQGIRDKAKVAEERHASELVRQSEERAIADACSFASRLLARVASPEQEWRLLEMLLEDLALLPGEQRQSIGQTLEEEETEIQVISAHPLAEETSQVFRERFRKIFPAASRFSFSRDESLLAGVRVIAGPWNLAANLRDELAFFRGGINGD